MFFSIFKPDINYDFIGKAPLWLKISAGTFVAALLVIAIKGANFGLDFTGGHELMIEVEKNVGAEAVRAKLDGLRLGETSVQSIEEGKDKAHFLVRVQRSAHFGEEEVAAIEGAFKTKYAENLQRVRYNPEAGDMIEVDFVDTATRANVDTSSAALGAIIAGTQHQIRQIRNNGRDGQLRFAIVLKGIDDTVMRAVRELDPNARAIRVEFVGPTVGKQLRDDGILAVAYALLAILIYIAFRFDFYYSPGAVACLFHDAVLVVGFLSLIGEEFSLTTIAAILTLVGYSINDTIVVFDRVRETAGKAEGTALREIVNRATNETLSRTVLTASTTMVACLCLMTFGRGTVLAQYGLIMLIGIVFGTYSSIYVAAPTFIWLREKFGPAIKESRRAAGSGGSGKAASSSV